MLQKNRLAPPIPAKSKLPQKGTTKAASANIGQPYQLVACVKLLSTKEAAPVLNVAEQTLISWRSNHKVEIPYVKVGSKILYRLSDLQNFLAANTHGAAPKSEGGV